MKIIIPLLLLLSSQTQAADYIGRGTELGASVRTVRMCGTTEDAKDWCESGMLPECCAQIEPASGDEDDEDQGTWVNE